MSTTKKKSQEQTSSADQETVAAICDAIRKLQQQEATTQIELVCIRVEIGTQLCKLKDAAGHGKWKKLCAELDYNETTAQWLMKLANSWIADQIRAKGTVLAGWMPTDLHKLRSLCELDAEQAEKVRADGWNCDEMTRTELSDAIKELKSRAVADAEVEPVKSVTDDKRASGSTPTGSATDRDAGGPSASPPVQDTETKDGGHTSAGTLLAVMAFPQVVAMCTELAELSLEDVLRGVELIDNVQLLEVCEWRFDAAEHNLHQLSIALLNRRDELCE